MNINIIFSNFFSFEVLDLDLKKIEKYIKNIKKNNKGRALSNAGGWQSDDLDIQSMPLEMTKLVSKINQSAVKVSDYCGFDKRYLKLGNIWANINKYKDFNHMHIHPYSCLSGVFYIKTNQKSGKLSFMHPNEHICYYMSKIIKPNHYNSIQHEIEPIPNQLILFPSHLKHLVHPNLSSEERISVSFNIITSEY